MGIFKVEEFAAYISQNYLSKFNKIISPVRLQKSLYFCFAYWGGFIEKGKLQDANKEEINVSQYDKYLFEAEFQAWVYGPVIPKIYSNKEIDRSYNKDMFADKNDIKEFVDDLLNDINEISDFKLVDISHNDEPWKKHFHYNSEFHNEVIPNDEIINEYVKK